MARAHISLHIFKILTIVTIVFLTFGTQRFGICQLQVTLLDTSGTTPDLCTINKLSQSEYELTAAFNWYTDPECSFQMHTDSRSVIQLEFSLYMGQ